MYKQIIYILFWLSTTLMLADNTIQKANQYYNNKQYEKAANVYISLLNKQHKNSSYYYNLGNCFYQLQQYPKAILYYEKALKQHPNNKSIKHNLALAQQKGLKSIEHSKRFFLFQWIEQLSTNYSVNFWTLLFLFFLWIGTIVVIWDLYRNKLRFNFSLLILGGLLFILFLFARKQYHHQTQSNFAIVLSDSCFIYKSPSTNSVSDKTIAAGNKVKIIDKDGNFTKVLTSYDKTVWLSNKGIANI